MDAVMKQWNCRETYVDGPLVAKLKNIIDNDRQLTVHCKMRFLQEFGVASQPFSVIYMKNRQCQEHVLDGHSTCYQPKKRTKKMYQDID